MRRAKLRGGGGTATATASTAVTLFLLTREPFVASRGQEILHDHGGLQAVHLPAQGADPEVDNCSGVAALMLKEALADLTKPGHLTTVA